MVFTRFLLAKEQQVDIFIVWEILSQFCIVSSRSLPKEKSMEIIMKIIKVGKISHPKHISNFHVLGDFKREADKYANKGGKLKISELKINR